MQFFVISYDTFDEILCKVFENTSLLSNEGDLRFFVGNYCQEIILNPVANAANSLFQTRHRKIRQDNQNRESQLDEQALAARRLQRAGR